jgi:hypothetical protein
VSYTAAVRSAKTEIPVTIARRAIPAHKVVVVFEHCHSGGMAQPRDPNVDLIDNCYGMKFAIPVCGRGLTQDVPIRSS